MSTHEGQVVGPYNAVTSEAISLPYVRLKMASDGTVSRAGAGEDFDGIGQNDNISSGGTAEVLPIPGTGGLVKMQCNAAWTAGGTVFGAASGLVAPKGTSGATVTGRRIGKFVNTGTAAGVALVRLEQRSPAKPATGVKTGAYTAVPGETVLCDPTGGIMTITLPAAVVGDPPITIKNNSTSTNAITIARAGSDTIDGATSTSISSSRGVVRLEPIDGGWVVV